MNWDNSRSKVPDIYRSAKDQETYAEGNTFENSQEGFNLVRSRTTFENTSQIEKHLPDILGRALARSWIDPDFRNRFKSNPLKLLAQYNVFLPSNILIEYETKETTRPRIVVYEKPKYGLGRKRLLYLQLIMMAGK